MRLRLIVINIQNLPSTLLFMFLASVRTGDILGQQEHVTPMQIAFFFFLHDAVSGLFWAAL